LTGARLLFESRLPGDLRSVLERATGSSVIRLLEQKNALGDLGHSTIPPPPDLDEAPPSSVFPLSGPVSTRDIHAATDPPPDLDEAPRTVRYRPPARVRDDD
jgi:23S rRNA (uracil1939-C5)-methyltransferase